MCRTTSRNAYLQYVAGALLGRQWNIDGIDVVSCSEVVCQLPERSDGNKTNVIKTYIKTYIGRWGTQKESLPAA